jgi:hypothetical protein
MTKKKMNDIELQIGSLVQHPKRPEWGPGKIVKVVAERIYVVFRDVADQDAKALIRSAVELSQVQLDPVLDNLPPLKEKDGVLSLPSRRVPFHLALEKFTTLFPQGFYDQKYLGNLKEGEREYKWAAHKFFEDNLGGDRFRQLLDNDLEKLVGLVEKCVGQVNLLYLTEAAALRDALGIKDAAASFLNKLADLLEAAEISEDVFAPFADAVCDLPAKRGRVSTWPVATVLPFLAQPDRHMLLKPELTNKVADSLGFQLNYRPEPNWLTYKSLLQLAETYREKLSSLAPRDLIDVQSFLWVACRGDG